MSIRVPRPIYIPLSHQLQSVASLLNFVCHTYICGHFLASELPAIALGGPSRKTGVHLAGSP